MWGRARSCFTHSTYSAIHKCYDEILRGDTDLSATLKRTPRRLSCKEGDVNN